MTGWRDEFAEQLRRAGLVTVGEWPAEYDGVLPPAAAWRPVAAFEAEPTVAVREDRPGLVAELNAHWYRLAVEYGVIGEDGEFLLDGARQGMWTRVRLAGEWDLAGVLGDGPGSPEFVTASTDGRAVLGVTSEEYEIWLIAVDRVDERQEEAARAAARESADEREAAWAALLRSPGVFRSGLGEVWVKGLALNPAAPEDVLRRLRALAPDTPPPPMRQLALDDPASTAELVERFSRDPHGEVRRRAATDPRLSAASAVRLLDDARRSVRCAAAAHPRLPARVLVRLLRDKGTAGDAARNPGLPGHVMRWMIDAARPGSAHG